MIDIQALHVAWYCWALGRGPLPSLLVDRCVYYVLGLDEWRYARSLTAATTGMLDLRLARSADDRSLEPRGSLCVDPVSDSAPLTYRYDPLDTAPGDLYAKMSGNETGEYVFLRDRTEALNLFGNGVLYESEALAADMLLTGRPTARL
jgi:hypothetical protein